MNKRLETLIKSCITRGKVTLASGKTSDFYVDARLVTLTPEGSLLAGQEIFKFLMRSHDNTVAGPTMAACPLVTATGIVANLAGVDLRLNYIRSAPKEHGRRRMIEGPPLDSSSKVLVVDDVATSGGSLVRAADAIRETGAEVTWALCLVDRCEGATEMLNKEDVNLVSLFTRTELEKS